MKLLLIAAMLFPAIASAEPSYLDCVTDDYAFTMALHEATGKIAVTDDANTATVDGVFSANEVVATTRFYARNRTYLETRTYTVNRSDLTVTYWFHVRQIQQGHEGDGFAYGTCVVVIPPARKI